MMTAMTAVNIFIFFILPLGFEGVRVDIHPPHLRVSRDQTNITVTCRSSAPITGCQFSWRSRDDWTDRAGPVLDLNMGAQSVADRAHLEDEHGYLWRPLLGYSYSGRGFSRGDCGVRMEVDGAKTWLISCRVKTGDNWVYDWMDLTASGNDPIPHTLEPRREVVVVQGGQARILLRAQAGLGGCSFFLPVEGWLYFNKGPSSFKSTGRHLYQGAGLSTGECGLVLGNIAEEDNGLVRSMITKYSPSSYEYRLTPLIVARPATPPVLTVSETGNNITATCRVEMSRPAPNITWFLGDQVILQDDSPGTEDESWRWPWMAGSWSHTLTVSIQPQDTGKELKCSVTHVALSRPLGASIVVHSTVCGIRRSNAGGPLVSRGEVAQVGEFPWHVGVYRKTEDSYEQWGAGSLITPQVVLSAAHCFWDETERKIQKLSEFWVVAGKTNRAWEDRDHRIQKQKILRVSTNLYQGRERNLGHDIALVFLKSPMRITDSVSLICLTWGSRPELQAGDVGVVPGWGYTENQTLSTVLRYIDLPFIRKETCFAALPRNTQPLLTQDKFCAGHRDSGQSVCGGDSGGGLVFLNTSDQRYYVRGIVSTDFRPFDFMDYCYTELYTAFTEVSYYLSWIERELSQFSSS